MESIRPRYLPEQDRISALAATILLAFLLTRFVDIPAYEFDLQLPGIFFSFRFNFRTIVSLIVAGLVASGADWLVRDHPARKPGISIQHWLLPALTSLVIGGILFTIPFGVDWWVALAAGGIVLMLVLVAEYITVDPQDLRYPIASAGLTALALSLFLAFAITLHSSGLRLFLRIPFLGFASALVAIRILLLRLDGRWAIFETILVALITAQIAAALHYWPISSSGYGLLILTPVYALVFFLSNLASGVAVRRAAVGPVLIILILIITAVLL